MERTLGEGKCQLFKRKEVSAKGEDNNQIGENGHGDHRGQAPQEPFMKRNHSKSWECDPRICNPSRRKEKAKGRKGGNNNEGVHDCQGGDRLSGGPKREKGLEPKPGKGIL